MDLAIPAEKERSRCAFFDYGFRPFFLLSGLYKLLVLPVWLYLFAHSSAQSRRIAAALSIQYKKLPGGGFSQATIISVLDADGKIVEQSAELGHADPEVLEALNAR